MSQYIDYTQITGASRLRAVDTDGSEFTVEDAVIVPIVIEDAATLASGHTVGASVDAATAQTIARAVMDALKTFTS